VLVVDLVLVVNLVLVCLWCYEPDVLSNLCVNKSENGRGGRDAEL